MHREGLQLQQSCAMRCAMQCEWREIGIFFSEFYCVLSCLCPPPRCSRGFCHLLEHFLMGSFSPLQIIHIVYVRPHRLLPVLMWLMGDRRGASTSERNARNRNNFINETTKLFVEYMHPFTRSKQTNKKTHQATGETWLVSESTANWHRSCG